jgi:hypothetical protein
MELVASHAYMLLGGTMYLVNSNKYVFHRSYYLKLWYAFKPRSCFSWQISMFRKFDCIDLKPSSTCEL